MQTKTVQQERSPNHAKVYASLDAWRGLASLMVVVHHTSSVLTSHYPALRTQGLYQYGELGYLGVQIFFVISGYCIANSAASTLRRGSGFFSFFRSRLRRVYPPCWFSLALIACFSVLASILTKTGHLHSSNLAQVDLFHQHFLFYVSNLTLTQVPLHQPFLSIICWTLCYEVAFYLIVGLVLVFRKRLKHERNILNTLHLITITSLLVLILAPRRCIYPFDLWPQFGLGILVYDLVSNTRRSAVPRVWYALVSALFLVFVACHDTTLGFLSEPSRLTTLVALVFSSTIALAYQYDTLLSGWRLVRWLSVLGGFSYSLYLTHFLTLGIVNQLFRMMKVPASTIFVQFTVSILLSVGFARLFYQFFERPFVKPTANISSVSNTNKSSLNPTTDVVVPTTAFQELAGHSTVIAKGSTHAVAKLDHQ